MHVDSVDTTRRAGLGDAEGEIAGAGADVGDPGCGRETHAINHPVGPLLDDAGHALQPGGALVTHGLGDLATEIAVAESVAAWWV